MIPMNQQDYIKYQQAFKGNRVKGAELFRSLLENDEIAPELVRAPAAAGAVFTDCGEEVNKTLPSILGETQYVPEMVLAYVNAALGRTYDTLEEAAKDSRFYEVFHGRDISELPLVMGGRFKKLLCNQDVAAGYSSAEAKYAIGADAAHIEALGIAATTITATETYTWQWTGTRVPHHGWYVFGAYANGYSDQRTARIWHVNGTGFTTSYTG